MPLANLRAILRPVERRIEQIFQRGRDAGQRLLSPFVCAGHPSPGVLGGILGALERGGAAMAEIGFPFSDPIADGPTIAAAMHEALARGTTAGGVMDEVLSARETNMISDRFGLVAMVSVSIVHRVSRARGTPAAFMGRAKESGFDAVLIPDLPLEEIGPYREAALACGLVFPMLISATTTPPRMAEIAKAATGFIYLMARVGITGEQAAAPEVAGLVARVRGASNLPIACGFGISTPEHVRAVSQHADAVIVGSALVRTLSDAHRAGHDVLRVAEDETRTFVAGLVPASLTGQAQSGQAQTGQAQSGQAQSGGRA